MGTPDFAVPVLNAIIEAGHDVVRVYTQPPRAAGRGKNPRKTPVHLAAEIHNIQSVTPLNFKDVDEQDSFTALGCDVAVVVAYGLILPGAVLSTPRHGCFNLHASLLPRWRGAAPIQRAIMAGDAQSGVCVMRMVAGLDEGPVCNCTQTDIDHNTTAGDLHDELVRLGAPLMVDALQNLEDGNLACVEQNHQHACYAAKIDKTEAKIDFSCPAEQVLQHIHGLSPFPGAWLMVRAGQQQAVRIKILRIELAEGDAAPGTVLDERITIACSSGAIRPTLLQREGRQPTQIDDFLRGFSIQPGTVIGGY